MVHVCKHLADLCVVDNGRSYVLSVALAIGDVLLMSNYDDICPKVIHTSLAGQLLMTIKCLSSKSVKLGPQFSKTRGVSQCSAEC